MLGGYHCKTSKKFYTQKELEQEQKRIWYAYGDLIRTANLLDAEKLTLPIDTYHELPAKYVEKLMLILNAKAEIRDDKRAKNKAWTSQQPIIRRQ